jgi:hypothetical protein
VSDQHPVEYPEAAYALAHASFDRALWLERAAHTVKYEGIHGAPSSLSPEQIKQRVQILSIAESILRNAAIREMNVATAFWQTYKRMTE